MHNKNSNNAYKITQVKLEVEKRIYDTSFVLLMLRWRFRAVEQDRLACGETDKNTGDYFLSDPGASQFAWLHTKLFEGVLYGLSLSLLSPFVAQFQKPIIVFFVSNGTLRHVVSIF